MADQTTEEQVVLVDDRQGALWQAAGNTGFVARLAAFAPLFNPPR